MRLTSYHKFTSLFIKVAIIAVSIWYIYKQAIVKGEIYRQDLHLLDTPKEYLLLSFVFILMFVNWTLEAIKWKFLITKIERISFVGSLQGVLTGVTVSIFTPNRTGEFAGRVFYLEKCDRIQATLITFVGSSLQLLVTVLSGAIALILFSSIHIEKSIVLPGNLSVYIIIAAGAIPVFGLIIYRLLKNYSENAHINKYKGYIKSFKEYKAQELLIAFLLSAGRYFIFSLQYFLLLRLFKVDITAIQACIFIPVIFFVISVVPTFALSEIGIRGAAALYFLGMISTNETGILASSFTLWLINIALPALAGIFCIFGLKIFRR